MNKVPDKKVTEESTMTSGEGLAAGDVPPAVTPRKMPEAPIIYISPFNKDTKKNGK